MKPGSLALLSLLAYWPYTLASSGPCSAGSDIETCTQSKSDDASVLLQGAVRVEALATAREEHSSLEIPTALKAGGVQVPRTEKQPLQLLHVSFSAYRALPHQQQIIGAILFLLVLICLITATIMRPDNSFVRALCLCVIYNCVSASVIETNKWMMEPGHFPYPLALTANHMLTSWFFANCLRLCCPSAFPALQNIEVTWNLTSKFLAVGPMFAVSLVCANAAYQYLSVPFLQVMKQCNIVVIYAFSVICGLDALKRCSVMLLACTLMGTLMTVQGELHFQLIGFLLQAGGSIAEAGKVVTQGVLMSGSQKLDPLSLVLFMAPACLCAILVPFCIVEATRAPEIFHLFKMHLPMMLGNATLAFALNVTVAMCIKYLSPVGYIMMGILKDVFIVSTSAVFLGESLTWQQVGGFTIALSGVAGYSLYRQTIDCFVEDELITGSLRVLRRLRGIEHVLEPFPLESCKEDSGK